MNYRITDSNSKENFTSRINEQRNRLSVLQERATTGKRINRPSDDPSGAAAVIRLKTSQTEIEQFKRSADNANQKLTAADDALNTYQTMIERVRTLTTQGMSDTATPEAKKALATEIDALRSRILSSANGKNGEDYIYGGSRQNSPPFDPATAAPNATAANAQYLQIEPGASPIAVGVTAETVFSDAASTIFTDLTNAANALRGTGDAVADRATLENTMGRLDVYKNLTSNARAQIGANMNISAIAQDRLGTDFLSFDDRIGSIENDDFAKTALELTSTQSALDATLQVAASTGKKSLFDYL